VVNLALEEVQDLKNRKLTAQERLRNQIKYLNDEMINLANEGKGYAAEVHQRNEKENKLKEQEASYRFLGEIESKLEDIKKDYFSPVSADQPPSSRNADKKVAESFRVILPIVPGQHPMSVTLNPNVSSILFAEASRPCPSGTSGSLAVSESWIDACPTETSKWTAAGLENERRL